MIEPMPHRALLSLLLLLPVPSFGVVAGMILFPGMALGRTLFAVSKVWVLSLPALWHLAVDGQRPSWSPPRQGGLLAGAAIGAATIAVIALAYLLAGERLIDPAEVKVMAGENGLDHTGAYLGGAAYWILVNSVLEEYLWRWFVVQQLSRIVSSQWAILLSALAFTAHHVVAMQVYLPWPAVIVASVGIATGGAIWSWLYVKYRSIWPGYLAHAGADLVIFAIGYVLIFY